ncbi:MAG: hypothetical protein Q8P02_00630 [Candidatus Micrarchaeota archaeon]|nr:hypothetical protein [Candidatus Micrarchaeota archaeon]
MEVDVLAAAALFLVLLSAGVAYSVTQSDFASAALTELANQAERFAALPCYCDAACGC